MQPASSRKLLRLLTFGFNGPHGRRMKRLILCQWIVFCLFLYIWIKFNGGLLPSFFSSNNSYKSKSDMNLLDFFPSTHRDASQIRWIHAVNSKNSLQRALSSDAMMIEADIVLSMEDTPDQKLIPVMANPPHVQTDITLEDWLSRVTGHKKALKFDFKSNYALEIALQKIQEARPKLNVPIHLSAAVLEGPNFQISSEKLIDANLFFRHCATYFPDSTLALGWVIGKPDNGLGESRYNWTHVKMMHDLIEGFHVMQPTTINVHARYVRRSIAQLRWLMEMMAATLTIYSSQNDISIPDLTHTYQRFPVHSVFYDLPRDLSQRFNSAKHDKKVEMQSDIYAFNAEDWRVVKSQEGETVYLGSRSVILQTGLLLTKVEYPAQPGTAIKIKGHVEFLQSKNLNNEGTEPIDVGFAVFLRATESSRPGSISGIRCFMSIAGTLKIETRGVPGSDAVATAVLPGSAECFRFKIMDFGKDKVTMKVWRPKSCDNMDVVDFVSEVVLDMKNVEMEMSFIAIKQSDPIGFSAVGGFNIRVVNV